MSLPPRKPGGLPLREKLARRTSTEPGVPPDARKRRVKVYCLTDEGDPDDLGTGHVTIDFIEGSDKFALAVVGEKDNDTLLLHNITSDDIYRKEGKIISWKDPETSLELALDFCEASGCSYIWDSMHKIQQNLQFKVLCSQVGPRPAFESQEASRESLPHDKSLVVHGELKDLPTLELSNLPLMLKIVLEHGTEDQMRVAELISQERLFFPKLVSIFHMCEALNNMDGLHMIFRLVKGIILLNNSAIFEKIFSDALILDIIGALEYDPEVDNIQSHRTFLQEHVVFKEAIPIRNASVVAKIHQTYRIGYIMDCILPRALNDATMESLNTIIEENNAVVSRLLKDDASFINELITRLKSSNISSESKNKLVLFLHELCILSKSLQPVQQLQLARDLVSEGVLDVITDVLQSHDKVITSTGTSIFMHFLDVDPNFIKYIIQQDIKYSVNQDKNCQEGNSLLEILIQGIITGSGGETEILRALMDPSRGNIMATNLKALAVQISYGKHFHKLIDVISSSCSPKVITEPSSCSVGGATMVKEHPAKPEILINICELLCFYVLHHPFGIKLNLYTNNSLEKILTITKRREKILVVAAVRLMRNVIGRKDEFLIDHVIKFNLLKPIIEAFVENGDRYNMLHSGVLELLEYIRKENIDSLVEYVSKSYWGQLVKFERLGSIQAFKLKYKQIVERAETKPSTSLIGMRKKAEERVSGKQEEYVDSDREDAPKWATHELKQPIFKSANGSETCHIAARPMLVGLVDHDGIENFLNPSPKRTVSSDDNDETLPIPIKKRILMDDKHTDVKSNKKPKLEVKIRCAKTVAADNLLDKHSDLKDSEDGSPGSQFGFVHTEGDCTETAQSSSPNTD